MNLKDKKQEQSGSCLEKGLPIFNDRPAIDIQLCRDPEMKFQFHYFLIFLYP